MKNSRGVLAIIIQLLIGGLAAFFVRHDLSPILIFILSLAWFAFTIFLGVWVLGGIFPRGTILPKGPNLPSRRGDCEDAG